MMIETPRGLVDAPNLEIGQEISSEQPHVEMWTALSLFLSAVSIVFGFTSYMVYAVKFGVFYGPGWLSMCFLVGLPTGLTALAVLGTSSSSRPLATRVAWMLATIGVGLSGLGAWNVFNTMLSLRL